MDNITSLLYTNTILITLAGFVTYQLKTIPSDIFKKLKNRFIFSVEIIETTDLYNFTSNYLNKFYKNKQRNVLALTDYKDSKCYLEYKHTTDIFFIKFKNKRIIIEKTREKLENANNSFSRYYEAYKIYSYYGKHIIDEFLNHVIDYNLSIKKNEQFLYTNEQDGGWRFLGDLKCKDIKHIINNNIDILLKDIEDYNNNEKWYNDRSLQYKRGYLFYGQPGNGKTSLAMALAKHINRNIYALNLNDITTDKGLIESFSNLSSNSILLLEDIDVLINKRDNNKTQISFSSLLNCMDGIYYKHNIIIIMTTNCIDKLDDALIRDGRIDLKINVDNPDINMVNKYLSIFYEKDLKLKKYNANYSMSKIQGICLNFKNDYKKCINYIENEI